MPPPKAFNSCWAMGWEGTRMPMRSWPPWRPPSDLENLAHGGWIGGVRSEPVDGLGREHHQIAGAQGLDGFFDFSLSSSYHVPMISRLRYQQSSMTLPGGRYVPQCRF